MERWDRWEDEEEKQDDFLFNSEEGRKEETRHIHSDTALNLVSMSVGPLSSLLSDEYYLQTKSKQRSVQSFVEEVQIVNADFWKEKGTTIAFLSCSSNAFK